MRVKDLVGRFGEDVAVGWLVDSGMRVLDRNWRCPGGELDVVADDDGVVVFVEVKTRSTAAFGDPAEAVNPAKASRIHRLAARWLSEHRDVRAEEMRFDIVSVVRPRRGGITVTHFPAAF